MPKTSQPIFCPFTEASAARKTQWIQHLWNSRDPQLIIRMFDDQAILLNRGNLIEGSSAIHSFLDHRLYRELHCAMEMALWSFSDFRISASFISEWQDAIRGQWFRSEGNMQMCFSKTGLIEKLSVSAFDIRIDSAQRRNITP